MKTLVIFLAATFLSLSCQTASSKVDALPANQTTNNSAVIENSSEVSLIRKIDFQNFTFPWTKKFGYGEKTFALKNGAADLPDESRVTLNSLAYVNVADNYDEQALVTLKIDDGNATYNMLYVYAIENGKPKLLESFEFGENNTFLGTAFEAHGELVIETYNQLPGDAECCPSVIEISYYKWQKDKFVLQGEPQKVSNGYVERMKKNKKGTIDFAF